jgi:hypothetical protein
MIANKLAPNAMRKPLLIVLVSLLASNMVVALEMSLFSDDHEKLDLEIITDIPALINDKSEDPEYMSAIVRYLSPDDEINRLPIKVKARGGTRRLTGLCEFPPLKLNFKKKSVAHTIFEGHDKLKLVVQCQPEETYRDYLLEEYLLYRTYNVITEASYRVRLVNLTVRDISDPKYVINMPGFIIEDDETLATRLNYNKFDGPVHSQDSLQQLAMNSMALFQYMIGNTDWYIRSKHNTDVFEASDNALIPVPFDFDAAGVINTVYAKPSVNIPITDVKTRFFKGYCTDSQSFAQAVSVFRDKKNEIYALYNNFVSLPRRVIKKSLSYYDGFYQIIDDPLNGQYGVYSFCDDMKVFSF